MAMGVSWRVALVIWGVVVVGAALYNLWTLRQYRALTARIRETGNERRYQQRRTVLENHTTGGIWLGLLFGLIVIGTGVASTESQRSLLLTGLFASMLVFLLWKVPLRENVEVAAAMVFLLGYGLLASANLVSSEFMSVLAIVAPIVLIVTHLSGKDGLITWETDLDSFRYQCLHCEHEFKSRTANMAHARCPECGETHLATVARER